MNRSYASAIALVVATLAAGNALAANPAGAKTREQVRAELVEAQRTGNILSVAETGEKLNEIYPQLYPQAAQSAGKTRAQVSAELVEAQRSGEIASFGETSEKLNQIYPQLYPQQAAQPSRATAEVRAEGQAFLHSGNQPFYGG